MKPGAEEISKIKDQIRQLADKVTNQKSKTEAMNL